MDDHPSRIAQVELRCSDPDQSAEFYARVVGLEVARADRDRAELTLPADGATALVLHRAERRGTAPRRMSGLFHTAFRYPDRASLAAAFRGLGAVRVPISGAADHGVSEAIYLDDPDGLGIELYRDRPRAQWPEPQGGDAVRMFTEPLDLANLARYQGEPTPGVDIGHVHLKVADPREAAEFWTGEIGMERMTTFGADAVFCAFDGYHHHIGANAWFSRGSRREPIDGPGLEALEIEVDGGATETPDGIPVRRKG